MGLLWWSVLSLGLAAVVRSSIIDGFEALNAFSISTRG
jgi:hypothetical protein